jgi:predicted membrane channel-forming protein YqfA (hemolysin III family)
MLGAALTDVNCPKQSLVRTTTFAVLVGAGLIPAVHWCLLVPSHVRWMFLDNLLMMFLSYGLGFTFWATRFPEVSGCAFCLFCIVCVFASTSSPCFASCACERTNNLPGHNQSGARLTPYLPPPPSPSTLATPQSVFPHRFDLLLSSHNLWHLCILLAIFCWHQGLLEYSEALHTLGCHYMDQPPPS